MSGKLLDVDPVTKAQNRLAGAWSAGDAAADGLAGDEPVAIAACCELKENFPAVEADPAEIIGILFHEERWAAARIAGIGKAFAAAKAAGD